MARQSNRRIDIGEDFYNLQLLHRAKSSASTTAEFSSITGNVDDQAELKERLRDLETIATLSER